MQKLSFFLVISKKIQLIFFEIVIGFHFLFDICEVKHFKEKFNIIFKIKIIKVFKKKKRIQNEYVIDYFILLFFSNDFSYF